jgi:hypothetical protein
MRGLTGLVVLFSAVLMLAGVAFAGLPPIDIDTDGDGVLDGADLCPGSVAEIEACDDSIIIHVESPKPNRWLTTQSCDDPFLWGVIIPSLRAVGWFSQIELLSIEDTFGCSCFQIIELMEAATGEEFNGHIKHGCSKSLLEDFMDIFSNGTDG